MANAFIGYYFLIVSINIYETIINFSTYEDIFQKQIKPILEEMRNEWFIFSPLIAQICYYMK